MTNNQTTLHKLDQMRLHGMVRALHTSLDSQGVDRRRVAGPPGGCRVGRPP